MDPITLGAAAAALLAVKFGEAGASEAGKSAWKAVARPRMAVAEKLRRPELASLASTSGPLVVDLPQLSSEISLAAEDDPNFRRELEGMIEAVQQNPAGSTLLAQARDNAKQANISGSNFGDINLS